MSLGGRPPKPTALHKLHGTFRQDRQGKRRKGEPKPVGDLQAAPTWFTDSQREGWDYAIQHSPAGLLKMIDRGMLVLWVEAEDRHRIATMTQAQLNLRSPTAPFLVKSPIGMVPSPYVDIIDRAAKIMFRASDAMGFSPVARPRIRMGDAPGDEADKNDPWSKLRVIPGGRKD